MDEENEVRIKLKDWEKKFFFHHYRKPTSKDIKSASVEIQDLYRKYSFMRQQHTNANHHKLVEVQPKEVNEAHSAELKVVTVGSKSKRKFGVFSSQKTSYSQETIRKARKYEIQKSKSEASFTRTVATPIESPVVENIEPQVELPVCSKLIIPSCEHFNKNRKSSFRFGERKVRKSAPPGWFEDEEKHPEIEEKVVETVFENEKVDEAVEERQVSTPKNENFKRLNMKHKRFVGKGVLSTFQKRKLLRKKKMASRQKSKMEESMKISEQEDKIEIILSSKIENDQPLGYLTRFYKIINDTEPLFSTKAQCVECLQKIELDKSVDLDSIADLFCSRSKICVLKDEIDKNFWFRLPTLVAQQLEIDGIFLILSPCLNYLKEVVKFSEKCEFIFCKTSHEDMLEKWKKVDEGKVKFLFVDSAYFFLHKWNLFFQNLKKGVVYFLVDQAQSLSIWNHSFNPSYLQVVKILHQVLNAKTLAFSSTEKRCVNEDIAKKLDIPQYTVLPQFSVDKFEVNVSQNCKSKEELWKVLNAFSYPAMVVCLEPLVASEINVFLNYKFSLDSKAGLKSRNLFHSTTSFDKTKTMKGLANNKVQILVSLFNILKSSALPPLCSIKTLVFYDGPSTYEQFFEETRMFPKVENISLFYDSSSTNVNALLRPINGNTVERSSVKSIIDLVVKTCDCEEQCVGHYGAIPKYSTMNALNLPEKVLLTCLFTLQNLGCFQLLPDLNSSCKLVCYEGVEQMKQMYTQNTIIKTVLDKKLKKKSAFPSSIQFDVIEVAKTLNLVPVLMVMELQNLAWNTKSVIAQFSDISFHYWFKIDDKSSLLDAVYEKMLEIQNFGLSSFQYFQSTLQYLSTDASDKSVFMSRYENAVNSCLINPELKMHEIPSNLLTNEINAFIDIYGDESQLSGLSIAKIFHGISSPSFPVKIWGNVKRFWSVHLDIDFHVIRRVANEELVLRK